MKVTLTIATASLSAAVLTLFSAPAARADDEPAHRLGDHPAIVVQRLYKAAGYDYASKFYPHPAGLRLYAEQPRDPDDSATATAKAAGDAKPVPAERAAARDSTVTSKVSHRVGG